MTRARRLLLALCLVAAGCGDDGETEDGSGTTVATVPQPGTETTTSGGGTTASGDSGADTPTTASPVTSVAPSFETTGPPGSAAPIFLRPRPATSILVEVGAEDGAEPTQATIDHLRNVLADVSQKPVQMTGVPAPAGRDAWSASDIRRAADDVGSGAEGEVAVIRLLFLHGTYAESDTVLGVAVRADTMAIFADRVDEAASPLIGPAAIEAAVVVHELGHLLGLVDLYRDTGRDDPEHPGHSTNRGSVMFWAVESTLVTDLLTGGPPRDFDAADRADLDAIRAS